MIMNLGIPAVFVCFWIESILCSNWIVAIMTTISTDKDSSRLYFIFHVVGRWVVHEQNFHGTRAGRTCALPQSPDDNGYIGLYDIQSWIVINIYDQWKWVRSVKRARSPLTLVWEIRWLFVAVVIICETWPHTHTHTHGCVTLVFQVDHWQTHAYIHTPRRHLAIPIPLY